MGQIRQGFQSQRLGAKQSNLQQLQKDAEKVRLSIIKAKQNLKPSTSTAIDDTSTADDVSLSNKGKEGIKQLAPALNEAVTIQAQLPAGSSEKQSLDKVASEATTDFVGSVGTQLQRADAKQLKSFKDDVRNGFPDDNGEQVQLTKQHQDQILAKAMNRSLRGNDAKTKKADAEKLKVVKETRAEMNGGTASSGDLEKLDRSLARVDGDGQQASSDSGQVRTAERNQVSQLGIRTVDPTSATEIQFADDVEFEFEYEGDDAASVDGDGMIEFESVDNVDGADDIEFEFEGEEAVGDEQEMISFETADTSQAVGDEIEFDAAEATNEGEIEFEADADSVVEEEPGAITFETADDVESVSSDNGVQPNASDAVEAETGVEGADDEDIEFDFDVDVELKTINMRELRELDTAKAAVSKFISMGKGADVTVSDEVGTPQHAEAATGNTDGVGAPDYEEARRHIEMSDSALERVEQDYAAAGGAQTTSAMSIADTLRSLGLSPTLMDKIDGLDDTIAENKDKHVVYQNKTEVTHEDTKNIAESSSNTAKAFRNVRNAMEEDQTLTEEQRELVGNELDRAESSFAENHRDLIESEKFRTSVSTMSDKDRAETQSMLDEVLENLSYDEAINSLKTAMEDFRQEQRELRARLKDDRAESARLKEQQLEEAEQSKKTDKKLAEIVKEALQRKLKLMKKKMYEKLDEIAKATQKSEVRKKNVTWVTNHLKSYKSESKDKVQKAFEKCADAKLEGKDGLEEKGKLDKAIKDMFAEEFRMRLNTESDSHDKEGIDPLGGDQV